MKYIRYLKVTLIVNLKSFYIFLVLKVIKYNFIIIFIFSILINIFFREVVVWAEEITLIKDDLPVLTKNDQSNNIPEGTWVKVEEGSYVLIESQNQRPSGLLTAALLSRSSLETVENPCFTPTPQDSSINETSLQTFSEEPKSVANVNTTDSTTISEKRKRELGEVAKEVIFLRNHSILEYYATKLYKGPWDFIINSQSQEVSCIPISEGFQKVTKLPIPLHELYPILQKQAQGQLSESELEAFLSKKYFIPDSLNPVSEELANNIDLMPQWIFEADDIPMLEIPTLDTHEPGETPELSSTSSMLTLESFTILTNNECSEIIGNWVKTIKDNMKHQKDVTPEEIQSLTFNVINNDKTILKWLGTKESDIKNPNSSSSMIIGYLHREMKDNPKLFASGTVNEEIGINIKASVHILNALSSSRDDPIKMDYITENFSKLYIDLYNKYKNHK